MGIIGRGGIGQPEGYLGGSAWESNPPARRSHGGPSVLKTEPGTSPRRTSARTITRTSARTLWNFDGPGVTYMARVDGRNRHLTVVLRDLCLTRLEQSAKLVHRDPRPLEDCLQRSRRQRAATAVHWDGCASRGISGITQGD